MSFSIEKKGYCVEEVDAYIDDLETKYIRLQSQNAELEQKLATAKRLIRRFSDTENALKQNIADSKRAAAYMISDARDRSEELLDSAREGCGEIISDLDMQISERMTTIDHMKAEVAAFKDELFGLYSSHIELIDKLAGVCENFEYVPDYTAIADAVDSFEAQDEAECSVPEFVEYPEESIFTEIEEDAEDNGEFVISEAAAAVEEDQISFETEEEEATGDEEIPEADGQIAIDVAEIEDEDIFFDDEVLKSFEAIAVEAEGNAESADETTDYFKFLSDFANSEDEIDS